MLGVGRLNWRFVGIENGGRTAAELFSFTATCKYTGIGSFAYLRDVLGRLPTHQTERQEGWCRTAGSRCTEKPAGENDADVL
jgi:hypothetical protein